MATHQSIPAEQYHAGESGSANSLEWMARVGYVAKGVVYAMIGLIALKAAFGTTATTGSEGAIREIGTQPFGQWLLTLTAIGLLAYCAWRIVQAVKDTEHQGSDGKGMAIRIGYAISALSYLALAALAASIAWGIGRGGGGASEQERTAQLMSQPFGRWLVAGLGLIIVGIGVYQLVKAYTASFMRDYDTRAMSAQEQSWLRRLARLGLSARGVTFGIIGGFLVIAAVQVDPNEARGLGGALQSLAEQPYGTWLLAVVALGLIAYGAYCISLAAFRRFRI